MFIGDQKIRVAMIEDQREVRERLGALISETTGFAFVGGFATVEAFLKAFFNVASPAELVLIDLGLPGMDGIEGIRVLKERWEMMISVILTVHADDDRIFRGLCAGASGYLLKSTLSDRLMQSLQDAMNGGAPISPEVASKVVRLFRTFNPPKTADHNLTPHETRLLGLLAGGHTYKTAGRCCINAKPESPQAHSSIYPPLSA